MFGNKFSNGIMKHPGYNGGKGGSAPATPNYEALAREQAKGNLDLAKYVMQANRINQYTPYGSITYSQGSPTVNQSGYDAAMKAYNDQLAAYNKSQSRGYGGGFGGLGGYGGGYGGRGKKPVMPNIADYTTDSNTWSATQTLSPEQQKILEQNQSLTQSKLGYGQDIIDKANAGKGGIDLSQLPSYGINPGETYSDAIMRRLQPQQAQAKEAFDAKMANQGVVPGTQAYDNAYRDFSQAQNDQLTSAIVGGMQTGLSANQQAYNQLYQNANLPINQINALQSGSQVTNPQGVNSYNMPQVSGPDLVGAAQNTYNAQLQNYNAENAAGSGFFGGLMGLGNLGMQAYKTFSDINMKENVKEIGALDNGLKLYAFDYKPEFKDLAGHGRFFGVMAQEVEKVIPEAVSIMPNGYKAVNYSMLGA